MAELKRARDATRHTPKPLLSPPTQPASRSVWSAAYSAAFALFAICLFPAPPANATESWHIALSSMPLETGIGQLNMTNCVKAMLTALQSNNVVKGLVFMPGATDEFYFFRRAKANLTNSAPTLLDAVNALTSQTRIRATFHPPLLLLHTTGDPLDPIITVENPALAEKLKAASFVKHAMFNDRDWDAIQPILRKTLKAEILPARYSSESWHFYR